MSNERTMYDWFDEVYEICKDIAIDRLREIAEAERDGRNKALPCKIGDEFWAIGDDKKVYSVGVCYVIRINQDEVLIMLTKFGGGVYAKDIGRSVFKSRKAAEAALAGEIEPTRCSTCANAGRNPRGGRAERNGMANGRGRKR